MVVIVDFTDELFTGHVSQEIEPTCWSTLTNCTKVEMYELLFGDVNTIKYSDLPDISYYRPANLSATDSEIMLDYIKNLNPNIIIYGAQHNEEGSFTNWTAKYVSLPARLHIRLCQGHKEIETNTCETIYWIELNDKKIMINEELNDENTRKILFTQMAKFHLYHKNTACYVNGKKLMCSKNIHSGCLRYLKKKIITDAILEYLQNNKKQDILDEIAKLQKQLDEIN